MTELIFNKYIGDVVRYGSSLYIGSSAITASSESFLETLATTYSQILPKHYHSHEKLQITVNREFDNAEMRVIQSVSQLYARDHKTPIQIRKKK